MKKFVLAGLFAIAVIAISQQQASAWTNQRFSIGLNWSRQAGGNNFVWGAYRNGQVPGPEAFGGGQYGPSIAPSFMAPMPHQGYTAPMPQAQPTMAEPPIAGHYASPYQFANYPRPVQYYYYPAPAYYYYSYGYGYGQ